MRYRSYRGSQLRAVWILIATNFILFIATYYIAPQLIWYLGLQPSGLLARPWTILTSLFVHGGWGHIIANLLTLYFCGGYLSRPLGENKFLIIYFSGGILGNILFALLAPASSIGIGASGAIFALGGVLTILRPKLAVFIFPIPAPIPLWIAVIGGFLILSFLPNIAWQAHLGGLAFGLAAGYFLRRKQRRFF